MCPSTALGAGRAAPNPERYYAGCGGSSGATRLKRTKELKQFNRCQPNMARTHGRLQPTVKCGDNQARRPFSQSPRLAGDQAGDRSRSALRKISESAAPTSNIRCINDSPRCLFQSPSGPQSCGFPHKPTPLMKRQKRAPFAGDKR